MTAAPATPAEVAAVLDNHARFAVLTGDVLDILPRLPPRSCHLLVADSPYSSGGATRAERTKATARTKYSKDDDSLDILGDKRDQRQWITWCGEWLRLSARALVPGSLVATFVDWRQIGAMEEAFGLSPVIHRGTAPWWKRNGRPQKGRPRQDCEFIVWGSVGERPMEGPSFPGHYDHRLPAAERRMFCQKPLALLRELVAWCPKGGVVLDPFAGTGTTAAAAVLEGRRAITCDLSATNTAHTLERLQALEVPTGRRGAAVRRRAA